MNRLADAAGVSISRARWIHWTVRIYLGDLDRRTVAPQVEDKAPPPEPVVEVDAGETAGSAGAEVAGVGVGEPSGAESSGVEANVAEPNVAE